jgi:two-component system, cell cycle sensor histidine kinase and response regulator CckA
MRNLRVIDEPIAHVNPPDSERARMARRVLALSPTVLYALRIDPDELRATWIGGNFCRLFGFRPDELRDHAAWSERIHPEDRTRVDRSFALPYESDHVVMEYRFRHGDGRIRWIRDERQLIRTPGGEPIEVIGTWADVTDRVLLEEQLRQSQKMEAIGVLAGGVAHDFNNLLTVIGCSAEVLRSMVAIGDPRADLLADIAGAAERGAALTRQLLLFSRAQITAPTTFDPNEVLRGIEKMLRRLIGEDIKLCANLAPSMSPLLMDPGQLEQVILNLVVNARDAMPRGGTIGIATHVVELDAAMARRWPDAEPGRYVCLEVGDTGCGMSPEVIERIFEPFFTTKGIGKGTGLGLATVFGIVHGVSGFIDVTSTPGTGSTFRIYLPASEGLPVNANEPAQARGGGETILLVEDEPAVRRATHVALSRLGYHVLAASGATTALALAAAHNDIDILLTDVVLPDGSGCEVAATLVARQPGLAVIFMSGYIDDAVLRHGVAVSDSFLQKPFTADALAQKIREALD